MTRQAAKTIMKLIHTADLQLGKPHGRFEPEVRAALTEARFDAIDAIGKAATLRGADHVLVAGDVFDTEAVSGLLRCRGLGFDHERRRDQ